MRPVYSHISALASLHVIFFNLHGICGQAASHSTFANKNPEDHNSAREVVCESADCATERDMALNVLQHQSTSKTRSPGPMMEELGTYQKSMGNHVDDEESLDETLLEDQDQGESDAADDGESVEETLPEESVEDHEESVEETLPEESVDDPEESVEETPLEDLEEIPLEDQDNETGQSDAADDEESVEEALLEDQDEGRSDAAVTSEEDVALDKWKKDVLNKHNQYRGKHGARRLVWSDSLARDAARCLPKQRYPPFSLNHCRSGENIAAGAPQLNPVSGVAGWYNEIRFTPGKKGKVLSFNSKTGHYTQVVWKGTKKVGCAKKQHFMICNYSPPGNMGGQFKKNVKPL